MGLLDGLKKLFGQKSGNPQETLGSPTEFKMNNDESTKVEQPSVPQAAQPPSAPEQPAAPTAPPTTGPVETPAPSAPVATPDDGPSQPPTPPQVP